MKTNVQGGEKTGRAHAGRGDDRGLWLGQVAFEVPVGSWIPKSGAQGKGYVRDANLRFPQRIDGF